VQYVLEDEVVVLAWQGAAPLGRYDRHLRLRGLDPAAKYQNVETGREHGGALLAHRGLPTGLSGDLAAALFHLRRTNG
jgi:alpha-galactosidase